MQSIVLENLLLASLWSCLGSKLQNWTHGLRCPWFKCLSDTVKFRLMHKAFRTWVICSRSTTSTKIGCLFSILWLNEDPRVKNSSYIIIAEMCFSKSWAWSQGSENSGKNLLINFMFKLGKFQCFCSSTVTWMCWIFNLVAISIQSCFNNFIHTPLAYSLTEFHHRFLRHFGYLLGAMRHEESSDTF